MKGIVRVDAILSIALFIILLSAAMMYIRNAFSKGAYAGKRMDEKIVMLDNMIHGMAGLDATREAEIFFVTSGIGYVNVSLSPHITFNPNATRAYLLPEWKETEVWTLETSPKTKILVNATSGKYAIVLSNKRTDEKYGEAPASTRNDSTVMHISIARIMDEDGLENLQNNISFITKHVSHFRVEASSSYGTIHVGYNISSFQDIYSLSYPWLCMNSTADTYSCNITLMVW